MNLALILSGAALGLASGGHCIAMCGAGSSCVLGSDEASAPRALALRLGTFHGGRVAAYACIGALLGGTATAFHALTEWVSLLRPLWTMANTVIFLLGMSLLLTARQPQLLSRIGERAGQWLRGASGDKSGGQAQAIVLHTRLASSPLAGQALPAGGTALASRGERRSGRTSLALGLSWALIPCGPLYSAWTLALFAGDPISGALTAAAFALVSGTQLAAGQWWFARFGHGSRSTGSGKRNQWDRVGVRVAGAALCLSAGYSIATLVTGGDGSSLFCL